MNGSKILGAAVAALSLVCATGVAVSASAEGPSVRSTPKSRTHADNRVSDDLALRILRSHNVERKRLGLPPLVWSTSLQQDARAWGKQLAREGRLRHDRSDGGRATGENLWMGTSGHWKVEQMVGRFIAEKQHYRHGNFPEISRTGHWKDVAHYTQIVWRDTKEVGCSVVNERGWDVLVCRYWPAGNVWGQKAY